MKKGAKRGDPGFGFHEAASRSEYISNKAFLDLYNELGLTPDDFGITNLVKCPLEMRPEYIYTCSYWLEREISLMENLELIVCLGRHAGKYFGIEEYGIPKPLRRNRKAIMIYHPSYVKKPLFNQADEHKKQMEILKIII
jgi:uracil-DNA glycosylase family 4